MATAAFSLWSLYYFWCAACDPIVGIAIDMLKARGVEPTSLLLAVTPFWAYLMSHLWAPGSSDRASLLAVLLPFGLLQALELMLVSTVLGSVFPAGPQRQAASLARQLLGVAGLLVGMVAPPYVTSDWAQDKTHNMSGPFVYVVGASVLLGSLMLAVLTPLPYAPDCTPSKGAAAGGGSAGAGGKGALQGLRDIVEVLASHKQYRPVLLFSLASQGGNALFATSMGMFLKHVAGCTRATAAALCVGGDVSTCVVPSISAPHQRTLVPVAFYIAMFLFGPGILAKARDLGVARVLSLEFGVYGVALGCTPLVIAGLLRMQGAAPFSDAPGGATDAGFWGMLVCSFALGTAASGISLLPDLVIAAAVDKDSVAEGRNRSGSFFGARQISNRVGSAVASKLSGLVLAHVGYSSSAGQQGASAQLGIALVGFAFPAAAYLGASCLAASVDIKPAQPDDKSMGGRGGNGQRLTSPSASKKKQA